MTTFNLKRDGNPDLVVNGQIIADVSGRKDGLRKWTEIRIFRANGGRYVVTRDRISELPGEVTTHEAEICENAAEVIEALRDGRGALGRLGKEAFEEAATKDQALARSREVDVDRAIRCILRFRSGEAEHEWMEDPLPSRIQRQASSHIVGMSQVVPGGSNRPQELPARYTATLELESNFPEARVAIYTEVAE